MLAGLNKFSSQIYDCVCADSEIWKAMNLGENKVGVRVSGGREGKERNDVIIF